MAIANSNDRLILIVVWMAFLASIGAGVWNGIDKPFFEKRISEDIYLITDDKGNVRPNIDFTSEEYRAPFIFQHKLRNIILLTFLFSSKILVLVHIDSKRVRIWLYFAALLVATAWIWLRLVSWDFWITETVWSKVLGEPILYETVPVVFFLRDCNAPIRPSITYQLFRLPVELLLLYPWWYVWGFTQLFILGWIWI